MNYKLNSIIIFIVLLFCIGYVYLDSFVSLIVWSILFLLGYWIFPNNRNAKNSNFYIFSRSFIIITFIGIFNVIDNYNVTGSFYGFGGDDRAFFSKTLFVIRYGIDFKNNIGLYEYLLAFPAKMITLIISRDLNILDLLPVNWFIGATIPVLINSVSKLLFKTGIKFEIILLSLLLNSTFYDTIIHLYRDSLLYCVFLLGVISYIRKKYIKFSIFTFFSALLRGAHAALLILLLSLLKIYKSTKILRGTIVVFSLFTLFFISYQQYDVNIFSYMSQFYEIGKEPSRLESYSFENLIEERKTSFRERQGHQNYIRQLTYKGNLIGIFAGVGLQVFYPITFHFPHFVEDPSIPKTKVEDFSFMAFIRWFSIIAWIWVIPLLILGFISCYKRKGNGFALIVFYIISLLTVTIISMQGRHGLIFIIFHPIICQLGYNLFLENKNYKFRFKQYQKYVIMFLFIWNITKLVL